MELEKSWTLTRCGDFAFRHCWPFRFCVVVEDLLLLRVDRDDQAALRQCFAHLLVDVLKLSIAIEDGCSPRRRLAVALKAVAHLSQQPAPPSTAADRMVLGCEFHGEDAGALARPARSGDSGSPLVSGLNESLQPSRQVGVERFQRRSPAAFARRTLDPQVEEHLSSSTRPFVIVTRGQPADPTDRRNATAAQSTSLACRKETSRTLVQMPARGEPLFIEAIGDLSSPDRSMHDGS